MRQMAPDGQAEPELEDELDDELDELDELEEELEEDKYHHCALQVATVIPVNTRQATAPIKRFRKVFLSMTNFLLFSHL